MRNVRVYVSVCKIAPFRGTALETESYLRPKPRPWYKAWAAGKML